MLRKHKAEVRTWKKQKKEECPDASSFHVSPPETRKANRPLIDFLLEWSARKNATPAQLSLAWLLAKKPFVIPIPGTTRILHLEEDLGAFNVSFCVKELTEFDQALNGIKIRGERLNPRLMALSEVEAAVK